MRITTYLSQEVRTALDQLLLVIPGESQSRFEQLKAEPSAPGVKHLQEEIAKLQTLRALGVPAEALGVIPFKVLQILKRRLGARVSATHHDYVKRACRSQGNTVLSRG